MSTRDKHLNDHTIVTICSPTPSCRTRTNSAQVIVILLVILLIGLAADKVIFSPWERFVQKRWGTGT